MNAPQSLALRGRLATVLLPLALAAMLAAPALQAQPSAAASAPAREKLATDAPRTTQAGHSFVAPAGWTLEQRGPATWLEAPEGGSLIVLVDVQAADADAAVAAAWKHYKPNLPWALKVSTPANDRDGWTDRRTYSYVTSPNEKRDVEVSVRRAGDSWNVLIYDMDQAVGEKRAAQASLVFGKLLPKGYQRESFAGKRAHELDAARVEALKAWVQRAMAATRVPGVAFGVVQNGKLVYAGGLGQRALGDPTPVDADTRFMVASNTKAMVTLMLARLVDQRKLDWEAPAVKLWPQFRLGNADTTSKVRVKHLICACTGMPRQDFEWLLEFQQMTPAGAMTLLGTMQPTSGFGELYQYSNPMAAAAGYLGGHLLFPDMELGAAYDRAMQQQVFEPLGMKSTTHDFAVAQRGNAATAHAPDVDGRPAVAVGEANLSIRPMRPAGGAWSSVNDMLKYVAMELAEGQLPDGSRYVSREALLARRAPQVVVSTDITYGMGLMVDRVYGTTVVRHGGDMIGFHSDMMWLPEHGVGAVVLTNGDPGWLIRSVFRRKLLEVLFDGKPEADAQITAQAKAFYDELAANRQLLTVPADPKIAERLAARYVNPSIGAVTVMRRDGRVVFDFGEWASEVASRTNPDGSLSMVTIVPGFNDLEFVLGTQGGKRTLTTRDAQHEYVMVEP